MYLRKTHRRKKDGSATEYYSLAESVRIPGKKHPRVKVIHNFGRADHVDVDSLKRLVASIQRVINGAGGADSSGFGSLEKVVSSRRLGVTHVTSCIFEKIGFSEIILSLISQKMRKAPHILAILAMIAHRLDDPGSKRSCCEDWLKEVWLPEGEGLEVDQLYRAMDVLAEHGEDIEREIFWRSADLFQYDLDLVFYDTTTAWFEIENEDPDQCEEDVEDGKPEPRRKRGHSKEGRNNDPQVVIALAVTRDGMPIRSWVLPGNTTDVTTVKRVKDDLHGMNLGQALFVGDAGMHSKANLEEFEKSFGRYVIATPIARIKEVREKVLSHPGRYTEVATNLKAKEVVIGEGPERKRYIVCLNRNEAKRQKRHRESLLNELGEKIGELRKGHSKQVCKLLTSRRFGRYLSEGKNGMPYVDRKKVKAAERMDGKFVLQTNDDKLSVAEVASGYKAMWIIEGCFRRMKTKGLKVRPMYHRAMRRIEAHVRICVLALMIQRTAEIQTGMTWRRITHSVSKLHAVECKTEKKVIVQTTKITDEIDETLKKLEIPHPPAILSIKDQ